MPLLLLSGSRFSFCFALELLYGGGGRLNPPGGREACLDALPWEDRLDSRVLPGTGQWGVREPSRDVSQGSGLARQRFG